MEIEDEELGLGLEGDVADTLDDDDEVQPPESGSDDGVDDAFVPSHDEPQNSPAKVTLESDDEVSPTPRKSKRRKGKDKTPRTPSPEPVQSRVERRSRKRNTDAMPGLTQHSATLIEPTIDAAVEDAQIQVQPSKRDKRRAREAAKKATTGVQFVSVFVI